MGEGLVSPAEFVWSYFLAIEGLLLFGPPAAEIYFRRQKAAPARIGAPMFLAIGSFILLTLLAVVEKVSFGLAWANLVWFCLLYISLCILAASFLRMQFGLLKLIAVTVTAIPILLGYVLATVGFFVIAMDVSQTLQPPIYSAIPAAGLSCEVGVVTKVAARHRQTGRLYIAVPFMPFLRREVEVMQVTWLSDHHDVKTARSFSGDYPTPSQSKEFCSQLYLGYKSSVEN